MYIEMLFAALIGYLLGSVPFALVIGKVFYHTDVRTVGSKNLGGGNTGRVLGAKAGLAVMTLDILKVSLAVLLASCFEDGELILIVAGLAAAIGHCYPLFARFKGGKAVATMYGFLFGLILCGHSVWIFLVPLIVFMVVLWLSKIVSLSSMVSAVAATAFVWITTGSWRIGAALMVFTVLIIVRHRKNIAKMVRGEENRIKWM